MSLVPLLALAMSAFAPADTVRYAVTFPNLAHHEARIVVDFPAAGDTLEVWMSRSSPGRYALHEFAKNVYDVRATDPGVDAALLKRALVLAPPSAQGTPWMKRFANYADAFASGWM